MRSERTFIHMVDGKNVFTYEDPRPLSAGRQPYVTLYVHAGGWFRRVRIYTRPSAPIQAFAGSITDVRCHGRIISAGEISRQLQQGNGVYPG
jgi:hypothetical protein